MKKFVYSAIALSMATGVSYANNGWTTLDQEISGLSSSLTAQNAGGPKVGGWVITSVRSQSNQFDTDDDGDLDGDELGFNLDEVRLHVTGDVSNDFSYKISFEFQGAIDLDNDGETDGEGEAAGNYLKDAYLKWKLMDSISATMGQFYNPTLTSATLDETKLLFLNRSITGELWSNRDQGIMASGGFEMLNWAVAVQNGEDNTSDDLDFTISVNASVMGKGAGSVEGAYGAAEGTNLTVGAFLMDQGAGRLLQEDSDLGVAIGTTDDMHFGLDAYFTMGAIAISAEYTSADALITDGIDEATGDLTTYGVTASYLLTEMYEAAIRFENATFDFGDEGEFETEAISIGVNRYSAGHNLKWTAQYVTVDLGDAEDLGLKVEDEIAIGLTLAF